MTHATATFTPTPASRSLSLSGLEAVYDTLAEAIDAAGPDKARLFLVKLALLNAQALGDAALFAEQVRVALSDL